ncbi:putative calcium-binding protein CML18 [Platanthera guangdongensis]|uniref:Calcium-binding protein CML18 n=1 Tax=Platanthera guangdongensis TaxID=2320717 RepID=A0ABR2M4A7_9ASPA
MEGAPAGIQKMEEVKKVFNRYDANGDGKISASELGKVVRALSADVSDEGLRSMIQEMDADHDGVVDLEEFASFIRAGDVPGRGDADLKDAFDMYDVDGNGLISKSELHLVLKKLGEGCSVADCSRMIEVVDADGDGNVNFDGVQENDGRRL